MSSLERQELLRNAVSFLADPKTQSSPLAKRVEFLESKGLSSSEIEDAMRQASSGISNASSVPSSAPVQNPAQQYTQSYPPSTYPLLPQPPPVPQLDWRDYFIMAVVSGGVMFGVISLARKFLLPHLEPPSSSAYESDKKALTAQFDAAEALLKDIQAETNAARTVVEDQKVKVEEVTAEVDAAVKEMKDGEGRTRDEMREIRQEVDTIKEMLPKMMEKNKETQTQSLAELQQELKSLKTLLLSRGPSVSGSSTPPPLPVFSGRPSIPAWQLTETVGSISAGPSSENKNADFTDAGSNVNGVNNAVASG